MKLKSTTQNAQKFIRNALQSAENVKANRVSTLKTHTIQDFIKAGKFKYKYGGYGICVSNERLYAVNRNGKVFSRRISSKFAAETTVDAHVDSCSRDNDGVVCSDGKKAVFVNNGDINLSGENNIIGEFPTISFECLGRFFSSSNGRFKLSNVGLKAIQNAELTDFTEDEIKNLTNREQTNLGNRGDMKGKDGFALVYRASPIASYVWHKSGSTLLRYKGKSILLATDEETYFGCELPVNARSLKTAYTSLIPKPCRGKKYKRQGEWFALPVKSSEVPDISKSLVVCDYGYDHSVALPVESLDSNHHKVCGDVIVTADALYVDGTIEHDQHETLCLNGWHRLYKNLAVRSFSQEGVD